MEAVWIIAVIAAPVFFNIYSSRIFEPDKATLVRSLALLALGAWVVKLLEQGGAKWEYLEKSGSLLGALRRIPLLAPVAALAAMYLVATIFSVTPRISLLGSYQRMQGTYTTFSYIVIFITIIANLRKKAQVERIITAAILASLPVSLYGILQRYQIDPVPWGGNVSNRIASNMGNSIFVAAYLIMIVPLTMGRIVQSFQCILREDKRLGANLVRGTIYVFIAALELIAIYMSGSRGPFLGLLAGLFFFFVLLSLYWRKRWVMLTAIAVAALAGLFLIGLNIPNGPLEGLRSLPWLGRFGQVFDTDQRTSQVRIQIWRGASALVLPHEAIVYPDGDKDALNFLRPLIGYGPEGMYVAYNQFYPPELGRLEKRNASPDRSHNETWDSLVITGGLGLVAYLSVFGSVFYYGLKWMGLVRSKRQCNLFLAFFIGGGVIVATGLVLWQGVGFLGVGLPFGMILGVLAYLTIFAILAKQEDTSEGQKDRGSSLMIIMLLAAVVAHFAEINFGIAIVATRTLFWVYAGLLLVVGYILPRVAEAEAATVKVEQGEGAESVETKRSKKAAAGKRRRMDYARTDRLGSGPLWLRGVLIGVVIVSIVMVTLGYDFVSNSSQEKNVFTIMANAMTVLPNKDNARSLGVLALVMTTWLAGTLLTTAQLEEVNDLKTWWKAWGVSLGVSFGVTMLFWLWHSFNLVRLVSTTMENQLDVLERVASLGALLTNYYLFLLLMAIGLAYALPEMLPARGTNPASFGWLSAGVAMIVVFVLAFTTNLRVIHADIMFKMADPFTKSDQWDVATYLYKEALKLSPNEDHYYLFLGRSYLEQAKLAEDDQAKADLVQQAEEDLITAQGINPLNTDHTANLARLYTWWAGTATEAADRQERAETSSDYYSVAVQLSPNNSTIWGEWAILLLNLLGKPDLAQEKLEHALELDDQYSMTQGLMGDYYAAIARNAGTAEEKATALEQALEHYLQAVEVATSAEKSSKIGYLVSAGNVYIELASQDAENPDKDLLQEALDVYQQALELGPRATDIWKIEETLARLTYQLGNPTSALTHAMAALSAAPEAQQERLTTFVQQLQALQTP